MNHQIKTLCLGLIVTSNLALHAVDSDARGRARFRGSGLHHGTKHSEPVMTIQELRVCQAYEQRLNLKSADIDRLKVDMQSKAKKINLLEEKITVQKATVDNYSKESVNGYNKLVSQHEDLTDRYNVWIPIYNSELEKYKASENDFNKSCANKTYYLDDMKTIQIDKKT